VALLQLVDNPDQRLAMGNAGRERAQHFSWERVSQRVLSYYERLAYEKTSARRSAAPMVEA
jgi:glycosyltransferase involved in cell wall biosynthesis